MERRRWENRRLGFGPRRRIIEYESGSAVDIRREDAEEKWRRRKEFLGDALPDVASVVEDELVNRRAVARAFVDCEAAIAAVTEGTEGEAHESLRSILANIERMKP